MSSRSLRLLVALLFACPLFATNPKLEQHTHFFEPKQIWNITTYAQSVNALPPGTFTYAAYSAVGYDLANTIALVNAKKEIVIVDTLGDETSSAEAIAAFRAAGIFPKKQNPTDPEPKLPIRAIIYTHNHIDHISGVQTFLAQADRKPCPPKASDAPVDDSALNADSLTCLPLIGQENIVSGVTTTATVTGTIINTRSLYMYGGDLTEDQRENAGIGLKVNPGNSAWQAPSHTFSESMDLTAAGVIMRIMYVPSETNDELAVFIPDAKNGGDSSSTAGMLLSAEVIQGPSFPNLYSLRGTTFRDPATWYQSVDELRTYNSWCMVPAHGTPLCGKNNITTLLTNFRDAIKYTHDQTVRRLNQGYTMGQLPALIDIPQYMITNLDSIQTAKGNTQTNPQDYLTNFYGSPSQSAREMYTGYLGFFQADPTQLKPIPAVSFSMRLIGDKGLVGTGTVLAKAEELVGSSNLEDVQFAAELTTIFLAGERNESNINRALKVKMLAFEKLSVNEINPNWMHWYKTGAKEICRTIACDSKGPTGPYPGISGGLTSPGIIAALPFEKWMNKWPLRLKTEDTDVNAAKPTTLDSLGFWYTGKTGDTPQGWVINIRGQVADVLGPYSTVDAVIASSRQAIQFDYDTWRILLNADNAGNPPTTFKEVLFDQITLGHVKPLNDLGPTPRVFFNYFDPAPTYSPGLVLR